MSARSNSVLSCALGEDIQRSVRDGEVSSAGGHLLFKENRLQQTCNAIFVLYPLKAQTYFLSTTEHSLFCKPWQMDQMGWTALGRRCLSATPFTTVIRRDGWCCTFPMVRKSTVSTQQHVFFVQPVSDLVCFSLADNAAHIWVKNCKELLPSSYNTSRFDQPLQAIEWLRNFRITNEHFLSKVCVNFLIGPFVGSKKKKKKS